MRRLLVLTATHLMTAAAGFGLGIYLLPILTAPDSPDEAMLEERARGALFRAEFSRDLPGNDLLHWGEGEISLTAEQIVHRGRLAPGPDYKLYLVPTFVDHEDAFLAVKAQSTLIGDVKTFDGFILDMPGGVDLEAYTTVLVWCEAFAEFIAAARYR